MVRSAVKQMLNFFFCGIKQVSNHVSAFEGDKIR